MNRVDVLRDRLEQAYRGSKYHSFLSSIKGVDEVSAAWEPRHYRGFPHMTGSILNLAYHLAGDKFVLVSHSFGNASVTWEQVAARFAAAGDTLAAARQMADE